MKKGICIIGWCVVIALALVPIALRANEAPQEGKAKEWSLPASYAPRDYGRVSEEVLMLTRPAKRGDVVLIVERLADTGDRVRYYEYTSLKDDFVTITVVEKLLDMAKGIDRVTDTKTHALPLDFTDQTSMNVTDFYGTPLKVQLTRTAGSDELKVQTIRERAVMTLDPDIE